MREVIKNKGYNKIFICLSYSAWAFLPKYYGLKFFCLNGSGLNTPLQVQWECFWGS